MSLWKNRKKYRFKQNPLMESTAYLPQPSAGWYHIYPFSLDKQPDYEELRWCLNAEETLVLLMIDIGMYRKEPLPPFALETLSGIFDFFKTYEKEMLVRITYDTVGKAMEKEPERMEIIEGHMRQIGPVFGQFAGEIVLAQGLFIGNWGEMHGSRFLSAEKLCRLFKVWRKAVGEEIQIAVRTPRQWRMLHPECENCISETAKITNVGLFNDGMFGSESDLGTYGAKKREDAGWEESWCRESELAFMESMNGVILYGGEAVGVTEDGALQKAVEEMRRTHISYLNAAHDENRLSQWKQEVCRETGVWAGVNGYDYIGAHMGIRPVLRRAEVKTKNGLSLELEIENAGFAGLMEDAEIVAAAKLEEGMDMQIELGRITVAPEQFGANAHFTSVCPLAEPQTGRRFQILVQMQRKRDARIYRFTNNTGGLWTLIGFLADS